VDRELQRLADRFLSQLTRLTTAVEKLAEEPEFQELKVEFAPPVCPHCGTFNPEVFIPDGGSGPLMECVLQAECGNCHRTMFAVPVQWDMLPDVSSYERYLAERNEIQDAGRTPSDN
jgi:hypothetical protein